MKGYGPTGVSYMYGPQDLVKDLIDGILVCGEDFPSEVSLFQVPPWLARGVAETLMERGVTKGYTEEYVFQRKGDNQPRLYVRATRREEKYHYLPEP